MKILMVNKFLYPKGGSETYIFSLEKILRTHGHEVQFFGLQNEKNTVGNRVNALVSDMEFANGIRKNLSAPFRIIYNAPARRELRRVLDDFEPDVMHLNNIEFHLTPSIILEAEQWRREKKKNLRIVYTTHDYQLVCPSHGMYDTSYNPCDKCLDGHYYHCVQTKCLKNSTMKSLLGTFDAYYWRHKKVYRYVDAFICCSQFIKSKLDTQPQFQGKTIALLNFNNTPRCSDVQKQDYILYFGRLTKEKGIETLLQAVKLLPDRKFVMAGAGEYADKLKGIANLEYVGFQSGDALYSLIANARMSVICSECYENCPFSVIESISLGTPVAGSRIGGIPELIRPGETGELYATGDAEDLAAAIEKIAASPEVSARYAENCRHAEFETSETYYEKLVKIYRGES